MNKNLTKFIYHKLETKIAINLFLSNTQGHLLHLRPVFINLGILTHLPRHALLIKKGLILSFRFLSKFSLFLALSAKILYQLSGLMLFLINYFRKQVLSLTNGKYMLNSMDSNLVRNENLNFQLLPKSFLRQRELILKE